MDLDAIRAAFRRPDKKRIVLARMLGVSPSEVTEILKGDRKIQLREAPIIADYLGLETRRQVPLVGYVGAGAEAHYYANGDLLDYVDAPADSTDATKAVEVRGDSLGPLLDRCLVFYDDVRSPVTDDLIGRMCVVGLPNDMVVIKQIVRARTPGLFHLIGNVGGDLMDQEVQWAARVKDMRPR